MAEMQPLLLNKEQARNLFAGMPEASFLKITRNHAIKIGNSYYWRPEDLKDAVNTLDKGVQEL